jgi:hypothetical protein
MGRFHHVESSDKEELSINTDALHDFDDYVCNIVSVIIKNKSFIMATDLTTLQKLYLSLQRYRSTIKRLINICNELSEYAGE